MITKYEKANKGKLLVAVLALFVVLAGAAVVFSDSDVNAVSVDRTAKTYTASEFLDGVSDGDTINLKGDVTISDALNLGNRIVECGEYKITIEGDLSGGTINGKTVDGANNCLVTLGADNLTVDGTKFAVGPSTDGSLPYAINTDEYSATIKGCEFSSADNVRFGAIHMNSDSDSVTLTVNNCDMGNGLIVYKGAKLNVISSDVIVNFVALAGGVTDLYTKNITLDPSSKITETIIGWDKSTIPGNMESYETAYNLKADSPIDLGNVSAGTAVPADEKPTLEIVDEKATYIGGTGVAVDKDNSNKTGIDQNIIGLQDPVTITGNAFLAGPVEIPAGRTMIITTTGSLDLNGFDLTVNGTLKIEGRGNITSTNGTEQILLMKGGSIDNSGTIGKGNTVTVAAGSVTGAGEYTGNGEVELLNVTGASFALVKGSDSKTYTLAVTGNIVKANGSTSGDTKTIAINDGAMVNGNLTISKDITLSGDSAISIVKGGILTVNGTMIIGASIDVGGTIIVNGSMNGTITAKTSETGFNTEESATDTSSITLNGNVSGMTVTVEKITTYDTDGDAVFYQYMLVSGAFNINQDNGGKNVVLSGNIHVDEGATLTLDKDVTVTGGTFVVDGTVQQTVDYNDDMAISSYVGAMYSVTSADSTATTWYIKPIAGAIAAIDTADDKTVTVMGEVEIVDDTTIADGQIIAGDGNITIAQDKTVTVQDGGEISANVTKINGMLVVMNGGTCTPATDSYQVTSTNADGDVTYAGFQTALNNAGEGDVITVTGVVSIEDSLTVPAGVTVEIDGGNLSVGKNLTVNGTLNNEGTVSVASDLTVSGTMDSVDGTLTAAKIYSTGELTVSAGFTTTNINGATYTNADGDLVITTIAKAVAGATEAETTQVNVYGAVSESADVVLGEDVKLTIAANSKVAVGSINVVGTEMTIADEAEFSGDVIGQYGDEGSTQQSVVTLNKVTNMAVKSVSAVNSKNVTVWNTTINAVNGVTIAQGQVETTGNSTVTASNEDSKLVIASGATLVVPNGKTLAVSADAATVDGTLSVIGTLTVTGQMTVNGSLSIEDNSTNSTVSGTLVIAGTLAVSETEDKAGKIGVTGTLIIGAASGSTGAAGTVSGAVALTSASDKGYIMAYPGSDMSGAKVNWNDVENKSGAVSTEVYINGDLYVTLYAQNNDSVTIVGKIITSSIKVTGLDMKEAGDSGKWSADANEAKAITNKIGANEAIYFTAPASKVTGTVSAGTGLDIYLDGVKYNGTNISLDYGEYEVRVDIKSGYEGTPTITFNGQTVTDGKVMITEDGFVVAASGATPIDYAQGGSTGGDSGMGLVEILLVILVIVVVILAIIVVLRMMRS